MNFFKTFFKRPNIFIACIILTVVIAYGSYELGNTSKNPTEKRKLIIPIIFSFTLVSLPLINYLIDQEVKDGILYKESEFKTKYNISSAEDISKKQHMDFIAFINKDLTLNKVAWATLAKEGEIEKDFKERAENNFTVFCDSQEAINGLLHSKKDEHGKEISLLKVIVKTAVIENSDVVSETKLSEKYKHLYAYLRAWLICSIRYQTDDLPIEWVKENAMTIKEIINALDYIRTELLNHEKIKLYISNENSIKLIGEYISKLSDRIKIYNKV